MTRPPLSRTSVVLSQSQENLDDDDSSQKSSSNKKQAEIHRPLKQGFIKTTLSDFAYGVKVVNSQYLDILWRYSIKQSIAITLPFGLLLWGTRLYAGASVARNFYDLLYYPLYSIWALSSGVASVLQLPLEVFKDVLSSIPALVWTAVENLPNTMAIPLVQGILTVRDTWTLVTVTVTSNQIVPFLSSVVAVLVWRPAVEEWEYRSILNKFLFAPSVVRNWIWARPSPSSSSISMVEYIPMDESNSTRDTKATPKLNTEVSLRKKQKITLPDANHSNRILLGSLLFATTRLGWLAWDPASGDLTSSPYSWTIGFLQSIMAHFSSQVLPEVQPGLKIWILLLAIHQTVSTFLVAQNVLAKVYGERGLVASVGAHVTWTISKGTIPLRIIWRFWQWSTNAAQKSSGKSKAMGNSHLKVVR
jgi:hypothetical protein